MTTSLLDHALNYASLGLRVFPLHSPRGGGCTCKLGQDCNSPAKHPRTEHGVKDATTDEGQIRVWWDRWPYANIGIATGGALRLVVLDVDPKNGGDDSLAQLERKYGEIPPTARVWTGSGGQHIYFQGPDSTKTNGSIRNKAGVSGYSGLDLRADGGYVVAPPSRHVSGKTYRWQRKETEIADTPLPLLDVFLTKPSKRPEMPRTTPKKTATSGDTPYGLAALEKELAALRAAQEGARNPQLNTSAYNLGQLIAGGELTQKTVEDALYETGLSIGLTMKEVPATIASGITAGQDLPRSAPDDELRPRTPAQQKPPKSQTTASQEQAQPQPAQPTASIHVPEIPTYTLGELMAAKPPPPEELIADRVLCRNTWTMLIGASNAGKTLAVIHLVEALSTGTQFLGRSVTRPCRVLWFSAEGGGSLLYDRLRHQPIDPSANDLVSIATLEEIGGQPPRLTTTGVREMLARMIRNHQADVCIIDPLVFFNLGADEGDTAQMGELAANVMWIRQDTGASIVIVHHTRKPPQIKRGFNPLDPAEARGAGVLIDLCDEVRAIARKDEDYWFGFPKRRWGGFLPTLRLFLQKPGLRFSVVGEEEPNLGRKSGPSKDQLREVLEGSLPLNTPLRASEIYRRVSNFFAVEKLNEKGPSERTVRNWLDKAADLEMLIRHGNKGNYRWELR